MAKEDDSDELDYGDDEEKEHKEEGMETDEPKQAIPEENAEKKPRASVEKEEKVRGSVSNRRASSPSSR